MTMISRDLAEKLNWKPTETRKFKANGIPVEYPVVNKAHRLTIMKKETVLNRIAINNKNYTGFEMIFGLHDMIHFGLIIDCRSKRVFIEDNDDTNEQINLVLGFPENEERKKKEEAFKIKMTMKYPKIIPTNEFDCGEGKIMIPEEIWEKPTDPDKRYPFYMPAQDDTLKRIIQGYLDNNIIEPSNSVEILPYQLIMKKDQNGQPQRSKFDNQIRYRLVVDCQKPNSRMVRASFDAPKISDLIFTEGRANTYTKLDCNSAYHSLVIPPKDRGKYAIKCFGQTYQFVRMIMGQRNSAAYFQRSIEIMCQEIRNQLSGNLFVYQDDIYYGSIVQKEEDMEKHYTDVDTILGVLADNGIKLNISKCQIGRQQIDYLGWQLHNGQLKISDSSAAKILQRQKPSTGKDLYRFTQACNFFRLAIPDFTKYASKLWEKQKDKIIQWDEESTAAYEYLRAQVFERKPLDVPPNNTVLRLRVDSSKNGCGGFLYYIDKQNTKRIIAYFSSKFESCKQLKAAFHLELLGIREGLRVFSDYIRNRQIIIESDHKPLCYIFDQKRIARYSSIIQEILQYDCSISYIKGSDNCMSDLLSRIFDGEEKHDMTEIEAAMENGVVTEINSIQEEVNTTTTTDEIPTRRGRGRPKKIRKLFIDKEGELDDIRQSQQQSTELQNAIKNHTNYHNLTLQDNTDEKYIKTITGQIVIPANDENLINQILYISHDMSGHFGQQKTMSILERSVAIPGLYKIVREYINQCEICLATNAFPSKEGRGVVTPYYSRPGESIAMDLRGKLPLIKGFNHIMMIVDANTKKWYTRALKGCKTEDVIKGLEEYMANNPTPKHIRLDQARGHISREMKTWATKRNIELDFSAAGHHSANSLAERSIGTLNLLMSKHLLQRNTKDWTLILNEITEKYNLCPNMSGRSPIENERESEKPIDILSMKLRERGETSQKKNDEENELVGKNATYKLRNREIFGPRNSMVSKIVRQRKHQVQLANGLWRHQDQLRVVEDKENLKRSVELE